MIRHSVWAILILLGTMSMANAAPIVVRSGDHEGFTRLVMQLPNDVQWQVTETRGLKTITVSGHQAGFDISRVFNVIPRDRLTGVRTYPSRLELELSCDCELNTFVERGEFLVVDIIDGPALPPLELRQTPRFISARPASRFNFGDLLWSEFDAPESSETSAPPEQVNVSEVDPSEAEPNRQTELINETRERLLFGIGDATSRGILEPATPNLSNLVQSAPPASTEDIYDSSEREVAAVAPQNGNIRITNSRDIPLSETAEDLMTSGAVCAKRESVMVSNWGDDEPFHLQIATLRSELYSEVDRLNLNTAKELARRYLYFGFGAEAKQVLGLSEELSSNNPELMDLADIMEYGYSRNPRTVHRYSDCDSEFALWSAMAAKELNSNQILNENAALRALAALPDHLKSFIAPGLSRRLTEAGSVEAASIALRNVELKSDTQEPEAGLARAEIEKKTGDRDRAEDLLTGIIDESAAKTPEALIALVDNRLAEGASIAPDVALLVETYAFERRNGPLAGDLLRAHTIASAYSGQFEKSFEAIEAARLTGDDARINELLSHAFTALALNAGDMEFLEKFYAEFPDTSAALSTTATTETARRLLGLGFATDALATIEKNSVNSRDAAAELVHAKALLATGQPEAALELLDGVEINGSETLRAEALLKLGQNAAAFDLFEASNTPDDAFRAAWLAEDWTAVVPEEAAELSDIRRLAEQSITEIQTADGMLATTDAALEQSVNARTALRELLQGFVVTPD